MPDNDFVVRVRLDNMLSIRVSKEDILVGKIIWADRKLEDSVSRKLLTSSDESYLNRLILKSANKIFVEKILLKVCVIRGNIIAIRITNM